MGTISMQAIVSNTTIQVVFTPGDAEATIYIVNGEHGSYQPRHMDVREYGEAGMSAEDIVRHLLEVVSISVEELDRMRPG
ncbi:hypothetical protein WS89_23845 [Burkholderia sp. MSMB1072]|uniref:hypothetical protein n=2 Tax=Burkholderia TaxID=32008 RepID=UPI00075F0123|nr:hypothetical protein [Burkholderia sp. MSMB1459WGS]KVH56495.1 hypothetical protein WS89_23845 [Burkholderia sp. MSMB1072]KVT17622.1 hypothetical protein WT24_31520 [Burkholderia sp. MSMB1078WGS]KWO49746.1 hypothetical protein WT97_03165 [Burkholderia sp. MSMB1459WGS]